jgi:hypothetical protein
MSEWRFRLVIRVELGDGGKAMRFEYGSEERMDVDND